MGQSSTAGVAGLTRTGSTTVTTLDGDSVGMVFASVIIAGTSVVLMAVVSSAVESVASVVCTSSFSFSFLDTIHCTTSSPSLSLIDSFPVISMESSVVACVK